MLPIMLKDLGKAVMREVMFLAELMLDSGTLVFNEGLNGTVFSSFRFMVLDGGIMLSYKHWSYNVWS